MMYNLIVEQTNGELSFTEIAAQNWINEQIFGLK